MTRSAVVLAVALLIAVCAPNVANAAVRKKSPPPPPPPSSTSSPPPPCRGRRCPPPAFPPPSPPPPSIDPSPSPPPPSPPPTTSCRRGRCPSPPSSPVIVDSPSPPPPLLPPPFNPPPPAPPPPSPPPPSPPPPAPPPPSPPPPSPPPPAPPPPSPPPPSPPPPAPPPPSPPPPLPPPPGPPPPSPPPPMPPPPSPPTPPPGPLSPPSPPPRPPTPPPRAPSPPPPPPPSPPRPVIPTKVIGSYSYGVYNYTIYGTKKTFPESEAFCNSRGGNLVSITSADEYAFLVSRLDVFNAYAAIAAGDPINLWLGLRINTASGRYWTDGTGLPYFPTPGVGVDVYAEGGCYSMLCRPGGAGCIWYVATPFSTGCYTVVRDGFVCKTDTSRVRAIFPSPSNNSTYLFVRPPAPQFWQLAATTCNTLGGSLVVVNDATEDALLSNYLAPMVANVNASLFNSSDFDMYGNLRLWIGLQYNTNNFNSYWVDGTMVAQSYLGPGTFGSIVGSLWGWCYAIYARAGNFYSWQPMVCSSLLPGYICEVKGSAMP